MSTPPTILERLEAAIAERRTGDPNASYVAKLNARASTPS